LRVGRSKPSSARRRAIERKAAARDGPAAERALVGAPSASRKRPRSRHRSSCQAIR
jgi:hypothetical protein